MSKKFIPIIAGAVAVVAIVIIAILGTNPDIFKRTVYVTSIEITNELYDTYEDNGIDIARVFISSENTVMVGGKKTFAITHKITPEKATDKKINYTSSDTSVATVNENGVVTFLQEESVFITLRSNDGTEKTAIIQLVWPAENTNSLSLQLESGNLNITKLGTNAQLYKVIDGNMYIYKNVEYVLTTDAEASLSTTTIAECENAVLKASDIGEFDLQLDFDGTQKTQHVVAVEYINMFMYGISYPKFLNTVDNLENTSVNLNFKDKIAKDYEVGTDNAFYFDAKIQNESLEDVSLADAHLVYTLTEITGSGNVPVNNNADVFTVEADGYLTFKESSVGKSYSVSIVPKYNFLNKSALTFAFTVVEGTNVWTHEDLKTAYADLDVNYVIMHSDIKAEVTAEQLDPAGRLVNWDTVINDTTGDSIITGDIYTRGYRTVDRETYAGKLDITLSGNYFKVDATEVPYLSVDNTTTPPASFGHSRYTFGILDWTKDSGYPCASCQTSIFKVQDVSESPYYSNEAFEDEEIINAYFKNFKLEGNTSTGIIYNTDEELEDEEAEIIAKQGSSSAGLMGRGAVIINTDNVVIMKTHSGIYQTGVQGGLKTNNTIINDSWSNACFGWRTSTFELRNTDLIQAGGAALCISDATITDEYSEDWKDPIVTFGPNVVIDNYVSGTEGFFIVNGFSQLVPTLKASLPPQLQQFGKTMLKDATIDGTDYTLFNFIFQFNKESSNYKLTDRNVSGVGANDGWTTYQGGINFIRYGDYLYNENNLRANGITGAPSNPDEISEKYAITGSTCVINKEVDSQITINYFDGYDQNQNEKYVTVERRNGYYSLANNPLYHNASTGKTALQGVSKITNLDDAFQIGGLAGGYLPDMTTDMQNGIVGTSSVAYLLRNELSLAQTLNTTLGMSLKPVKTALYDQIYKLNADQTTAVARFSQLSTMQKMLVICNADFLETVKANLAVYNQILANPAYSAYHASVQAIVSGFELVKSTAKTNSDLINLNVAMTSTNDLLALKDTTGEDVNLVELKIANANGFEGITLMVGMLDYVA